MGTHSLNALTIGRLAYLNLIRLRSEEVVGTTVNVFMNSVNIRLLDDELITITSRNIKSPININVEKDARIDFRYLVTPHTSVKVIANGDIDYLVVDGLVIDLRKSLIYNHNVLTAPILINNIKDMSQEVLKYLVRKLLGLGLVLELSDKEVNEAIINVLELLSRCIFRAKQKLANVVSYILCRYLGLGRGFTPSYDDFVRGFISIVNPSLRLLGHEPIALDLSTVFSKTSWVSGKLIEYACMEYSPEYIASLIEYLGNSVVVDKERLLDYLLNVMVVGHNSGFYMSLGMLSGIAFIHDLIQTKPDFVALIIKELMG